MSKKKNTVQNPDRNNVNAAPEDDLLAFVKNAENAHTVSTVTNADAKPAQSEANETEKATEKPESSVPEKEPAQVQDENKSEKPKAAEAEPEENISDIFAQKDREFAEKMGFAAVEPPKKPKSAGKTDSDAEKKAAFVSSASGKAYHSEKPEPEQPKKSEPSAPAKKSYKPKDPMFVQKLVKSGIIGIVAIVGVYFISMIYSKSLADDEISILEKKLLTMRGGQLDSGITEIDGIALSERENLGLSEYLCDSDGDGLSDAYEINVSKTDPTNPDSDADGLSDGLEIKASLDPNNKKTNGTDIDAKLTMSASFTAGNVTADVTGTPYIYKCVIEQYNNNSMRGVPGVIGNVYQFYAPNIEDGTLTFKYTDEDAAKWSGDPQNIAVYWYNENEGRFDMLNSTLDTSAKTVSTKVTESGIFVLGDTQVVSNTDYSTNIFFLIDNSGSMYPEALCKGSEENDVDFKRLDLATSIMDQIEGDTNFGLAKFTSTYTKLCDLTSDKEKINRQLDSIKESREIFNGTEIAGSLSKAVAAFKGTDPSDRNYILLLTDGMPTLENKANDEKAIKDAVDNNITVFVIGLGKYVDSDYLTNIAESTDGAYFQASNANALEAIIEKINSFMSYGIVSSDGESEEEGGDSNSLSDMFMIADTGFSAKKDGLAYRDFRTASDVDGTAFGITEFVSRYYTGSLELTAPDYTVNGKTVKGYDLRNFALFTDGKDDLRNFHIQMLDKYNEYLAMENKWDFRNVNDGVLLLTDDSLKFVEQNKFGTANVKFDSHAYNSGNTGMQRFLRYITFQSISDFDVFQCAVLDNSVYTGDDLELLNAFIYLNNLHLRDDCTVHTLGTDGSEAFDLLCYLMKTGEPVVVSLDSTVVNAVRLLRDVSDPNKYTLEVYDPNYPDQLKKVSLTRTPVLTQAGDDYQYTAKFNDSLVPFSFYTFDN